MTLPKSRNDEGLKPDHAERLAGSIAQFDACFITPNGDAWLSKSERAYIASLLRSAARSETAEWMEGVRLSVEHGWICVRAEGGWLLWTAKIEDMPSVGLLLEDAMKLAKAARLEK